MAHKESKITEKTLVPLSIVVVIMGGAMWLSSLHYKVSDLVTIKNDVKKIATGQFYLGIEAKKLGLVDELGGREEVIKYVEEKIGEDANLVRYRRERGFFSSLGQVMNEQFFYIGKGIGNAVFTKAKLADSVSIST